MILDNNMGNPSQGNPEQSEIESATEPSIEVHSVPEKYYEPPIHEKASRSKRRNRQTSSKRARNCKSLAHLDHELVNLGRRIRFIKDKIDRKALSYYKEFFQRNASPNDRATLSALQKQGQALNRMEKEVNGLQGAWEWMVEDRYSPFAEERCACDQQDPGPHQEGSIPNGNAPGECSDFTSGPDCAPNNAVEDPHSEEAPSVEIHSVEACYGKTAFDAAPARPKRKGLRRDDKDPGKSC
jgi:hypothetical protein